jgi:hypothetical protein
MSIDPSTSGTLDFKQASKVTFIGSSSNTVIDTVTGSFGIGVDVNGPSSNLHVVGNTRLEGDINMLHTSNNAAIKLNSNVVTEFPRSKKLIKYPRVALTGSTSGGYTAQTSSINVSTQDAWYAFDNSEPDDNTSRWRTASPRYTNSGATPPNEYLFTGSEAGDWISIQLPEKMKLVYYTMTGIHTHTPQEGVIYGYDSDTSTWHKVSTFYFDTTSYPVNNTPLFSPEFHVGESVGMYSKYAMIVTKTNGSDAPSLYEWKLHGLPEYDSDAAGVDVKVTSYPNVPNTDWLEVYYDAKDLADGAVTSVDDLTPSGTNDGTATNVTVSDGAFVFNGTNSNVTTGTTLSDGAYPHSVSLWYYTNDDPSALADYLFQLGDNTENNSPNININGATFYLSFFGNYLYNPVASTGIQAKKWVQISYSYDGGPTTANNPAVYIDGKQITMYGPLGNSAGSALSLVLGTDPNVHLTIGSRRNGTLPVNGKIANFRLFNRALTQDEVWQLYSYQKEYFGHGDLSMTLKAGRLYVNGDIHANGGRVWPIPNAVFQRLTPSTTGSSAYYTNNIGTHHVSFDTIYLNDDSRTIQFSPSSTDITLSRTGMYEIITQSALALQNSSTATHAGIQINIISGGATRNNQYGYATFPTMGYGAVYNTSKTHKITVTSAPAIVRYYIQPRGNNSGYLRETAYGPNNVLHSIDIKYLG